MMANHDIIVVGASMGGIKALSTLVAQLPADLPAAIFVVQHVSPESPSMLPHILQRAGALPAKAAEHGERIEQGCIYVAPPNHHLLVMEGHVHLSRGPRENRTRPAVDPLFRSAAVAYGARVVGVILSGYLDDGTAGLLAVKRCGGVAVVQEPSDAAYPDMPQSAIDNVDVDHSLPLAQMGQLLAQLARQPAGESPPVPEAIRHEVAISQSATSSMNLEEKMGELAPIVCPECGGSLWQIDDQVPRYRCHVGHAYTLRSLLAGQDEALEQALWAALRALQERERLLKIMVRDERKNGREKSAAIYIERLAQVQGHVQQLQGLLFGGDLEIRDSPISDPQNRR